MRERKYPKKLKTITVIDDEIARNRSGTTATSIPEQDGKTAAPKKSKSQRKMIKGQNEVQKTSTNAHSIAIPPDIEEKQM